jgi:hypothetical protein
MKAARRRRQEARKSRNTSNDDAATTRATPTDWVGDAFAWFSSVVAPPPSKPEPATLAEKKESEKIKASPTSDG